MAFQQGLELVPANCFFSSACPVPRPTAVTSLLLTQETIRPRDGPTNCMHARYVNRSWLRGWELMPWSRSSLSPAVPLCWVTPGKLRGRAVERQVGPAAEVQPPLPSPDGETGRHDG